jgi:hypothetical protein
MSLFHNHEPTAEFSADGCYRWKLTRGDQSARCLHWICLNPSKAGISIEDPSTRRIGGFTWDLGYNGYTLHNLFAVCATDPRAMMDLPDPVGAENHAYIMRLLDRALDRKEPVICAWGNDGTYMDQANTMLGWLEVLPPWQLWCLGLTKQGQPLHPLYVPRAARFIRMDGKPHKYPIEGNRE